MGGEFDRIARLSARFGGPPAPAVGIGDDCAVLPPSGANTVLTVDACVEGVHFDRAWLSMEAVASRALEAAMSDAAAMGASVSWGEKGGCGVLCAWTLPPGVSDAEFDALVEGTAASAERAGAVVLGGNLARGRDLALTTTVIARLDGPAMRRNGARVGDGVWVTGVVGAAALGLAALQAGRGEEFVRFVEAWRAPRARLREGELLARVASAGIDVSDGLAQDAGHIASASGVGIVIDAECVPMLEGQREAARVLGGDAVAWALTGGEDYELLVTIRGGISPPNGVSATRIGEVVEGNGVWVRRADGSVSEVRGGGFDHFG